MSITKVLVQVVHATVSLSSQRKIPSQKDTTSKQHTSIRLITAALCLFSHSIALAELLLKLHSSKELRNV